MAPRFPTADDLSPSRRRMLQLAASGAVALGLPRAALAAAATDNRLVLVLLRGALDGLAAVPPLGERRYAELRQTLALPAPGEAEGCLALDHGFALHPALAPLQPYYARGELAVIPATGNGYDTRSHFDAQDLMESGLDAKSGQSDGWLNRALAPLQRGERRLGLAVGGAVPLILRGAVPVASWEPAGLKPDEPEFLAAVARLYSRDKLLGPALADGLRAQNLSDAVLGRDMASGGRRYAPQGFRPLAEATGKLLAAEAGPRIAVVDMYGWDTHVNQGAQKGRLAQTLAGLAEGLDALAQALGPAWRRSAVVVMTEFGRTVRVNGSNGTDHGTASVMLVLGGAVRGGRIAGDWPGLDRLKEDRDLLVATDGRAVLKGVLRDHLGLDPALLGSRIFPGTAELRPVAGLIRA